MAYGNVPRQLDWESSEDDSSQRLNSSAQVQCLPLLCFSGRDSDREDVHVSTEVEAYQEEEAHPEVEEACKMEACQEDEWLLLLLINEPEPIYIST